MNRQRLVELARSRYSPLIHVVLGSAGWILMTGVRPVAVGFMAAGVVVVIMFVWAVFTVAVGGWESNRDVASPGFVQDFIAMLARWECTLNSWEWPDDMPFKPRDWDALPILLKIGDMPTAMPDHSRRSKFTVITPINKTITWLIGQKECLRWHHLNNLGRTEDQFERWWANREPFPA